MSARPEAFIVRRDAAEVEAELSASSGPLAGLRLAVKNNVDVAGFPTTAACPAYATGPAGSDAVAVARLRAAGATVVGVTNLDQFATGLVGQRSPYGGVRDACRATHVSGGSSSGSAVAVALGAADIAIGTDTAGSGRVPAAFQGIVGIKPTLGVVSVEGVVPACRSWDAVTIFARDLDTADAAMAAMAGGPGTRRWPADAPLAVPAAARVAVLGELPAMAPGWAEAFRAAADRLRSDGCVVDAIPFASFLAAARLLYDGGLVAERHVAVGAFVDAHPELVDPAVGGIISRAGEVSGSTLVRDLARLECCAPSASVSSTGSTRCWSRPRPSSRPSPRSSPSRWPPTPGSAPTPTSATSSTCARSRCRRARSTRGRPEWPSSGSPWSRGRSTMPWRWTWHAGSCCSRRLRRSTPAAWPRCRSGRSRGPPRSSTGEWRPSS
ncbi:amidase family protein [Micromonospora sp. NPDC047548]|uniref:amidase family protein n=1 Tax=Micromonospora sp. NPDC047548 TaxID=3155624 RepID=UPI00340B51B0